MASIKQRGDSFLVTVSMGYDIKGKKITKHKTFYKPNNMTPGKWEKEIQKLAIEFELGVEKGLHLSSNTTLNDFVIRWFKDYANNQLQPRTLESYKYELDGKILPALGHIKLSKLTPLNILSFLNNLLEDGVRKDGRPGPYSNRIIKYQWQILSSILQQAVYWQVINENPCKRVKCPKNNDQIAKKIEHLDENQTLILINAVKDEELKYQIATNIAIFCGLRIGEILGLTWNDIDFKNKTIDINKSRSYTTADGMFTKTTKTDKSHRKLNIPSVLVAQLKEFKLWQNGQKAICGDLWDDNWDNDQWLFTTWDGKGMHYATLSNWLVKFIKRYNKAIEADSLIPVEEKPSYILPVISFHKLRHTSATLLIAQNTDIRTVSNRLGHAQTSTTMNIYVHGLNSSDIKAANTLENLLSNDNKENEKEYVKKTISKKYDF